MLTDEAYAQRKWGPFPGLRLALQDKRVPDHYYGPTSVSNNVFEHVRRLMEISILTEENEATICDVAGANDNGRSIREDLRRLQGMLELAASYFGDRARGARDLQLRVSSPPPDRL